MPEHRCPNSPISHVYSLFVNTVIFSPTSSCSIKSYWVGENVALRYRSAADETRSAVLAWERRGSLVNGTTFLLPFFLSSFWIPHEYLRFHFSVEKGGHLVLFLISMLRVAFIEAILPMTMQSTTRVYVLKYSNYIVCCTCKWTWNFNFWFFHIFHS